MPTYNLFETIHNTWLQQFGKEGKDLSDATIDDLVRALEQQIRYKMHLMGRLKGIGLNQMELRLKAAHRFRYPKKIAQVVINSILGVLCIYSRSISLEGEERIGSCKRKFNTMIGCPHDSHCHDMGIILQGCKRALLYLNLLNPLYEMGIPLRSNGHGWEALDNLETTCN